MFIPLKNYLKLRELAYLDALTGCKSRNWWKYYFLPRHKKKKLDIAIIDVNNLKIINDTCGHNAGDEVILRTVETCSKYGVVIRMGGDEFLVLLKNTQGFIDASEKQTDYAWGVEIDHILDDSTFAGDELDKRMYCNKKKNKIDEILLRESLHALKDDPDSHHDCIELHDNIKKKTNNNKK